MMGGGGSWVGSTGGGGGGPGLDAIFGGTVAAGNAYEEYVYTGGLLTAHDVWVDNTKAIHLYSVVLTYTGGLCTQKVTTRISDGKTLTENLVYVGGLLSTKTSVRA